ncbi:UDP-N-acetylglucosamine 1-carboxyvinyltransferase [Methylobacterium sp. 4-46]|uniref:UDP-N-acetylglucosamine 1-carboxyvinyltransferase n=1 Tax=Methylobacterium sp. (strain 4-46) TaxID=426117 RepID=MURA_METS4|nr:MULTISPECIES: UDP-N-acetylglucosamine 1-carboxyvinyltransferase [Methylobacterium]B0UL80.1 RecName: Full=UDP-N-acetylglucosamine 1-carboxyvinyltransferase; AltName: Full=Enoylpyruvate transferase; AltName: Full=UDP-N-acetylglucosamine enolpyruvyl transferase; Short=EPT [Methylobacterium sp. 4-46]ACA17080.1 UDP-N-acetylglucosamine 1-carboxyvinyltransferase [Methylobacterium sp. 4-46]WFT82765.1 UDP-N-acetylglucosamine 1-carboxyvinyltransferase [Methylobacterium nodulans]
MDRIHITGGAPLQGEIPISGAKNAALPLMIASLLTGETVELANVPRLADIASLLRILGNHGVDHMVVGKRPGQTSETGQTIRLTASNVIDTTAPYELVSTMRASFWVVAPLLARFGEAKVSMPGGCAIGTRPVDLLLMALERLGASIEIDGGYVVARTRNGLRGAEIVFPKVTVGGTHVALMAAALAQGTSVIENAAREPEVVDLAACLTKMGARIEGVGTPRIVVEGVSRLGGARHEVLPDRIETGTYAMAVAMTGGDVILRDTRAELLHSALDVLATTGTEVTALPDGIRVRRNGAGVAAVDVTTDPFPGFPTDLQAQFMALMTRARGQSRIRETIFENRFMHVQELARLGARIRLDGDLAVVDGVERLKGAPVMATDLRASVSLVIAGLAAEGETTINRVYHLDRGFEALEAKLGRCGAQIRRERA